MRKKGKEEKGEGRSRRLRTEAEVKFDRQSKLPADLEKMSQEELIHELRVHQIELEMQNEELKNDRLAIEESRDRYVRLYDFAPVGYLTLSRDVVILEANLASATLLGVDRQKLLEQRFRKFVDPDDVERWDRYIVDIFQRGGKGCCELALKRPDGSSFYVKFESVRVDLLTAASKVPETVVHASISDITERKKAEDALKESEIKFKTIFDEFREGIALAEYSTRRFFMCNAAMCTMLGYTEAEMVHLRVDDIHPQGELSMALEQFERQAKGEIKVAEGILVQRKDGSIFDADITTSLIILSGKKYLMGSFKDITESKKIQDERKEKLQDLEQFSTFVVDRELKMEILEKKVRELEERLKV